MNATALALPTPLPALGLQHDAAPPPATPVARLALLAATCVEQTAELMRLACRRGQLEDASAAARIAMPLAAAHSPHEALLRVLAEAQPALMVAPEERRLYLLRRADGTASALMRLRDNGRIGLNATTEIGFHGHHNLAMGITPRSVKKEVKELIDGVISAQDDKSKVRGLVEAAEVELLSEKDLSKRIKGLEKQMLDHAKNLEFEKAARVRDQLALLREQAFGGAGHDTNIVPLVAAPVAAPAGR